MAFEWDDMDYWSSGEWQVVQEKLEDLEKKKISYNPNREDLFNALDATPFDKVKVVFLGQDPYPDHKHATGIAFDVPPTIKKLPPTLQNILAEYTADTGFPSPANGSIEVWAQRGVLLWNVIPCCKTNEPLSCNWLEWEFLTKEIIRRLDAKGNIVFVNFGAVARAFCTGIDTKTNRVLHCSHPSPRGQILGRFAFKGSKVFTKCNNLLVELKQDTIDWKL